MSLILGVKPDADYTTFFQTQFLVELIHNAVDALDEYSKNVSQMMPGTEQLSIDVSRCVFCF